MRKEIVILFFQTAEHLANTYGDRAIKVARLANLTGKRWPVVGNKLHPDYPYIEAEVSNSGRFNYSFLSVHKFCG